MKRFSILLVALILIGGAVLWQHNDVSVTTVQVTAHQASIYDELTGRAIMTVPQGFSFMTTTPCDAYCYGVIGNRSVRIATQHVSVETTEQQHETSATTDETVTTLYDAALYASMDNNGEQVATVHVGVTLTLLQSYEEWVAVELFGQMLYMERQQLNERKQHVTLVTVTDETPLYLEATEQQVIATAAAGTQLVVTRHDKMHYVVRIGETEAFMRHSAGELREESIRLALKKEATAHIIVSKNTAAAVNEGHAITLLPQFRYPIVAMTETHYVLSLGGQLAHVERAYAALDVGMPALVYHHILPEHALGDYKHASSTVTTTAFEQQMHYLHVAGFQTLTAEEARRYMDGHITARQAVIVTFDDGLLSTKEYAYDVLKRYHMTSLQHIISARKDRTTSMQQFDATAPLQFLNDDEMAQMADVFSYEAHTFNLHILDEERHVSRLMLANAGELRDDLRQNLEDVPTATTFAYPFGQYKPQTIEVLQELGFALAFTTTPGYSTVSDSPYTLKRFTPTQQTTLEQFERYVNGFGL